MKNVTHETRSKDGTNSRMDTAEEKIEFEDRFEEVFQKQLERTNSVS